MKTLNRHCPGLSIIVVIVYVILGCEGSKGNESHTLPLKSFHRVLSEESAGGSQDTTKSDRLPARQAHNRNPPADPLVRATEQERLLGEEERRKRIFKTYMKAIRICNEILEEKQDDHGEKSNDGE